LEFNCSGKIPDFMSEQWKVGFEVVDAKTRGSDRKIHSNIEL